MLSGTSAPEIVARQKNRGSADLGFVEDKIGSWISACVISPIEKKRSAQAFLGGGLEESGWGDLIGVHILHGEGNEAAAEFSKGFHGYPVSAI
jgi:hypothetical protein